jgi:undecaprenyl-diphosphatase
MHPLQALNDFDLPILAFLTSFVGKSHLFDHLVNLLSRLDLFKGILLMCLFWYTWSEAPAEEPAHVTDLRQKRLVRVLIGTILLGALSRGLQLILPIHQRPLLSNLGLNFPVTAFDANSINNWNSFPSDHAMFFFALGTGLWSVNRAAGLTAFLWTIVVIDFPRLYLGMHYPSDVIAGALFGYLGMKLFLAVPLKRSERPLSGWRHAHQGLFMALLFFMTDQVGHMLAELRDLAGSAHLLLR